MEGGSLLALGVALLHRSGRGVGDAAPAPVDRQRSRRLIVAQNLALIALAAGAVGLYIAIWVVNYRRFRR